MTEAPSEFRSQGTLTPNGIKIADRSSIDALSQRGYGTAEKTELTLTFYEALFLMDKQMLSVKDKNGNVDFQAVLKAYEKVDENAWTHYIVYRDLRSRGYVVREGFGKSIDFRFYDRGAYGKDSAAFLVISTTEGKPLLMDQLTEAMNQTQSQKKQLVAAVINRRGEIVYYSVAPLTFK
jgi:tRNA-intron endonuclease